MTTVQTVFDIAIHLMDEQSQQDGSTTYADTQEYQFRTIPILNTTMQALYPYSDTCRTEGQGRPVCPMLATTKNTAADFAQIIPLDDTLAVGVLPYALAAHLLSGENQELSLWFLNRYNQLFADLLQKIPQSFKAIPTPYGLF